MPPPSHLLQKVVRFTNARLRVLSPLFVLALVTLAVVPPASAASAADAGSRGPAVPTDDGCLGGPVSGPVFIAVAYAYGMWDHIQGIDPFNPDPSAIDLDGIAEFHGKFIHHAAKATGTTVECILLAENAGVVLVVAPADGETLTPEPASSGCLGPVIIYAGLTAFGYAMYLEEEVVHKIDPFNPDPTDIDWNGIIVTHGKFANELSDRAGDLLECAAVANSGTQRAAGPVSGGSTTSAGCTADLVDHTYGQVVWADVYGKVVKHANPWALINVADDTKAGLEAYYHCMVAGSDGMALAASGVGTAEPVNGGKFWPPYCDGWLIWRAVPAANAFADDMAAGVPWGVIYRPSWFVSKTGEHGANFVRLGGAYVDCELSTWDPSTPPDALSRM